jgi:aspartyl-tRNA(Asn)/glutamyl-tRNA(Gln) amidotransferase subunit A
VDPRIQDAVWAAAAALANAGANVSEVELLETGPLALANRLIALAESSAYHAPLLAEYGQHYAPDVRARLELGQFLLARDYLLAQRLRAEFARRVNRLLCEVDVLLAPGMAIGAPRYGQTSVTWPSGPEPAAETIVRLPSAFNLSGHPVVAAPFGRASDGMPAGVQLVGRLFDEQTVLQAAAALERAT